MDLQNIRRWCKVCGLPGSANEVGCGRCGAGRPKGRPVQLISQSAEDPMLAKIAGWELGKAEADLEIAALEEKELSPSPCVASWSLGDAIGASFLTAMVGAVSGICGWVITYALFFHSSDGEGALPLFCWFFFGQIILGAAFGLFGHRLSNAFSRLAMIQSIALMGGIAGLFVGAVFGSAAGGGVAGIVLGALLGAWWFFNPPSMMTIFAISAATVVGVELATHRSRGRRTR